MYVWILQTIYAEEITVYIHMYVDSILLFTKLIHDTLSETHKANTLKSINLLLLYETKQGR